MKSETEDAAERQGRGCSRDADPRMPLTIASWLRPSRWEVAKGSMVMQNTRNIYIGIEPLA